MQVEEVKRQFAEDIINHPKLSFGQKKQALMFLRDYSTKGGNGMASCFTIATNYINFCVSGGAGAGYRTAHKSFIAWKEIKKLLLFRGGMTLDELIPAMRMSERSLKNSLGVALNKGYLFYSRKTRRYYAQKGDIDCETC